MKTKTKTMTRLLMVPFLLTLLGCSEETYQVKEHSHSENKNRISLSQFKNETKIKDFKTVFKVPISTSGMLNRTAELSDFIVDTIAIQKYVSENQKTTYSFRVYSLVSNVQYDEKYNLIYSKENDVWEKSIIAFKEKLNASQNENRFEEFQKLYDTRFENISLDINTELCFSENYSIHCDGSCSGVCDGFGCPTGQCIVRTVIVEACFSMGGNPSSSPTSGSPNNNGGGFVNPYQFLPNTEGNLIFDTEHINQYKAQNFFQNLVHVPGAQQWATENPENYNQIIQYLIQSNWTNESNLFANELINASNDYILINGNTEENQTIVENFINDILSNDEIDITNIEVTPPDCESFNFVSTGLNWQSAAVSNIHFQVTVLTPQGVYVSHVIDFPQPILFEAPKNLLIGNTTITPGMAASASATALKVSMQETVKMYGNKPVSELMVSLFFEQRLKHNYPLIMPGGRVKIHPTSLPVTPTQYQTNAFGIGDCN